MTATRRTATALAAGFLALASLGAGEGRLATTMYSSQRAAARGDLIRIVVSEETSASKNHSQAVSREFSAAAAEGKIGNANSSEVLPKALSMTLPSYSLSGSSEFTGDGGSTTSETLSTSLTAQVVDVLPNGILV
ncbi:MAG: flagellar basal body L-ring protein FlgH, partial [Lentisphaeria bacterium]|nr:flagellar basal body L-ring protein FlgH [Lentisphaeria bacterium]